MRICRSLLLAISLVFPCSFFGQSTNAALTGFVDDPSKAVIGGAQITAINTETGVKSSTTTNNSGVYVLPGLIPGTYRIEVDKQGFKGIIQPGLVLHVQDVVQLNFHMALGSMSETVTVTGGAPLVETQSAAVSTVVDRQFAENLPLNGRSFQSLINLTPGVVVTPSTNSDPGQFSVNGQRTNANYWMVDGVAANLGVPANSAFFNGAGMAGAVGSYGATGGTNSLVSVDALEEFRIQTSTYAPEFGRTPGAQISIVTRSGTDRWHGSLFDYFRNEALDANDWFADNSGLPKPPERQNDFGGTFSGPLLKGRTFFFFSYEGQRLKLPQVAQTTVPCDATCTVSGNVRAAAQPVMQPYLNAFPLPNGPEVFTPCSPAGVSGCPASGEQQTDSAQFNSSYANSASLDAYSLRLDHKVKDKVSLFARYDHSPSEILTRGGPYPALSNVFPSQIRLQTATAGVTWMLSATASNDFRFNYSRVRASGYPYVDNFGGAVPPPSYPLPAPFSVNDSSFDITIGGLSHPFFFAGKNAQNLQRQFNFVNGFSWSRGAHNLKFGIDYRRLSPVTSPATYQQSDTFSDMPSTLTPPPQLPPLLQYVVESNNTAALLFHNVGAYAQDTWHANSRLTLIYGLRWDIDFAPTATNGYQLPAVTGYSSTNLSNIALAPAGTPLFATDYSGLAPRIGVAYRLKQTPRWQSVVRGGFGAFYDLASSQVGIVIPLGYPFSAVSIGSGGTFPLDANSAKPPLIVPPNSSQNATLSAFDPHLREPYTMQWNFALEQALGEQQALTLSYIGAHGARLIESATVLSPPFNANYGVMILTGNTARSNYEALQAQFKRRLSGGLEAQASYTWSHSLDDASTGSGFGNSSDSSAGGFGTYGPSDFDIRHTFSAAFTYDVPVGRVHGFVRPILAGWSTENILQARSATPVDVADGNFLYLHNGYNLTIRPDVAVPGQPFYVSGSGCAILFNSQCPGGRGFNPLAFTDPPVDSSGLPLREGNLARNALRAFGMAQWDFALHRDFPIHEAIKMEFRAEMFNLLNHPNFGPQQGTWYPQSVFPANLSGFGVATQMLGASFAGTTSNVGGGALSTLYQLGGPRSIQLALKLTF
jgi:outer membrane receptor protein involved in Fe transport